MATGCKEKGGKQGWINKVNESVREKTKDKVVKLRRGENYIAQYRLQKMKRITD